MFGLLNIFKKKKAKTESSPLIGDSNSVKIYNKKGEKLDKNFMNDKEKRMSDILSIISKAGETGKYMVCVTIHDPENKLKMGGGDLHHFTFLQDFKNEDRYGCLDEYAKLMGLGNK